MVRAGQGIPVLAWVPYTGGHHHQVRAWAGEWTRNAVHLRWFDADGAWDVWTWLIAVQRAPRGRIVGLPATMRPETIAYRGPQHHRDAR